jgi:hypothetical protein
MAIRVNIDAVLADADWPKRTPDHFPAARSSRYSPDQPRVPGGPSGGQWTAGGPQDLPDLAVAAGMDAYSPEAQQFLRDYAASIPGFPPTPEDMAVILEQLYGEATPDQIARGMAWYEGASALAQGIADKTGCTFEEACAVVALCSPGRMWEGNAMIAGTVAGIVKGDDPFEVSADKIATLRDQSGLHGPGSYRPSELSVAQLSWVHPDLGPPEGMSTYAHYPQVQDAIAVLRGDKTIDEAVGGSKVRNFYNNVHDPHDPRWVTVDTLQVRASLPADLLLPGPAGKPPLATRAKSKVSKQAVNITYFTGKPKSMKLGIHAGVAMYPFFAEAVKIAAAKLGILPNQYQAITWTVLREKDSYR